MYQFILMIHVFIAVFIIALVLVQQGKGATMGAAFGAGASQTIFGSRGSGSFLFRVTVGLAFVFFATSIALNYMATRATKQQTVITLPTMPAPTEPVTPPVTQTSSSAPETTPVQAPAIPGEIPARN